MTNVISIGNRVADDIYRCLAEVDGPEDLAGQDAAGKFVRRRVSDMIAAGEYDWDILALAPRMGVGGRELADGFRRVFARYDDAGYPSMDAFTATFMSQLDVERRGPMLDALRALAREADRSAVGRGSRSARVRTCVTAMTLSAFDGRLDSEDRALVLAGSAGLDLDPGPSGTSFDLNGRFRSARSAHALMDLHETNGRRAIDVDDVIVDATLSDRPSTLVGSYIVDAVLLQAYGLGASAAGIYGSDIPHPDIEPASGQPLADAAAIAEKAVAAGAPHTPAGALFAVGPRMLANRHRAGAYDPVVTAYDARRIERWIGAIASQRSFVNAIPGADGADRLFWLDGDVTEVHPNGAILHIDADGLLNDPVSADHEVPIPAIRTPDGRGLWYRAGLARPGPSEPRLDQRYADLAGTDLTAGPHNLAEDDPGYPLSP